MAQAALAPDSFETKRWHARWLLALFLVVGAFFVAVSLSPLRQGFADAPSRGPTDVELYQAEVERIRAGESYYEAVAHELPERGYPTASVFNWRTPLPVWLVAKMPESSTATVIIGVAALGLVAASFKLLADRIAIRYRGALLPGIGGPLRCHLYGARRLRAAVSRARMVVCRAGSLRCVFRIPRAQRIGPCHHRAAWPGLVVDQVRRSAVFDFRCSDEWIFAIAAAVGCGCFSGVCVFGSRHLEHPCWTADLTDSCHLRSGVQRCR